MMGGEAESSGNSVSKKNLGGKRKKNMPNQAKGTLGPKKVNGGRRV